MGRENGTHTKLLVAQGQILTEIKNINKTNEEHKEMFKDVYNRINKNTVSINDNGKEINKAKGFAAAAGFLGGASLLDFFGRMLR